VRDFPVWFLVLVALGVAVAVIAVATNGSTATGRDGPAAAVDYVERSAPSPVELTRDEIDRILQDGLGYACSIGLPAAGYEITHDLQQAGTRYDPAMAAVFVAALQMYGKCGR
jgi:hypothetical protein